MVEILIFKSFGRAGAAVAADPRDERLRRDFSKILLSFPSSLKLDDETKMVILIFQAMKRRREVEKQKEKPPGRHSGTAFTRGHSPRSRKTLQRLLKFQKSSDDKNLPKPSDGKSSSKIFRFKNVEKSSDDKILKNLRFQNFQKSSDGNSFSKTSDVENFETFDDKILKKVFEQNGKKCHFPVLRFSKIFPIFKTKQFQKMTGRIFVPDPTWMMVEYSPASRRRGLLLGPTRRSCGKNSSPGFLLSPQLLTFENSDIFGDFFWREK